MNDQQFMAALESCELPKEQFSHHGHVRAAWLYLEDYPLPEAADRCAESIRRYANHVGATMKFHVTLTLAFMHIIAALRERHAAPDWETFAARCPEIFDRPIELLEKHYRQETLFSEQARKEFVPPDIEQLPCIPR